MVDRDAQLIETAKPTGELNSDEEAEKRKFLALAELRPLPQAIPPS